VSRRDAPSHHDRGGLRRSAANAPNSDFLSDEAMIGLAISVDVTTGCWLPTGPEEQLRRILNSNYGGMTLRQFTVWALRRRLYDADAFEATCHVESCCNPHHLSTPPWVRWLPR
jgi:hypothetical protein